MCRSAKFRAYMFENFVTVIAVCSSIAYNMMIYRDSIIAILR